MMAIEGKQGLKGKEVSVSEAAKILLNLDPSQIERRVRKV